MVEFPADFKFSPIMTLRPQIYPPFKRLYIDFGNTITVVIVIGSHLNFIKVLNVGYQNLLVDYVAINRPKGVETGGVSHFQVSISLPICKIAYPIFIYFLPYYYLIVLYKKFFDTTFF